MRIGLLPMAGKPVHEGHWRLLRLAAAEVDVVRVYVSTCDREKISGETMVKVWRRHLMLHIPKNVEVRFVGGPVKSVYDELQAAEAGHLNDTYIIYSDSHDTARYPEATIKRVAPKTHDSGRIVLRGVERSSTIDVSGTEMRKLLASGSEADKARFISLLPEPVRSRGDEIYSLFINVCRNDTNQVSG